MRKYDAYEDGEDILTANLARNVDIFEETRDFSRGIYYKESMEAFKSTEVFKDSSIFLEEIEPKEQVIEVVNIGTVDAILGNQIRGTHLAALNFADAYCPGGLVWHGEETQEECLCRCSSLYECLNKDECQYNYYNYNQNLGSGLFSDRLIYSENVPFFRDENYKMIVSPAYCDIVSCPAPLACKDCDVLIKRIKCIIGSAYNKGVDTVILGSWGCGAFGNNPYLVAIAFKTVLEEYKIFDKVIFAIRETEGVSDNNYNIFKEVLSS